MEKVQLFTLLLIGVTAFITNKGLKEFTFQDKFLFHVDKVFINKEYIRLISSGFLHVDWKHFAFNMITLYLFGSNLEDSIGAFLFFLIYLISLIGGNLFALYIHKNHSDYRAVGASGAVSGIVFAAIGLSPGMEIGFIILPFKFPAWLYAIGYVLYSIYGITSKKDNIGHEAHLGGAIIGLLTAIAIKPEVINTNFLTIALALIPTSIFLFLLIIKPHILLLNDPFKSAPKNVTIDDKFNEIKVAKQQEIDSILDKINQKGYNNLTQKEKERLDELSK
ncbi:rhomboid family intramembrane serine protease [Tenacibaculum sp. ZS6-P6]|uniref:rhomboid family intramembrane serine protease n=1 Tax=Tenacibaculum sp. ZS6-P6 TaxID=3447503 RepID=UPI003F9E9540